MKEINILDGFSGIGGFSLAIQRAGFKINTHYASELDKYAQMIYRRNFNGSIQLGDITKVGNDLGKIDIITSGFPCQAFSIAGKRRGFEDTRGTLFFEVERLCRQYRPSYMVLENVKGLASHEGGDTIRVILDKLRGLDYSVQLLLLNTKDFGIPQNRERFAFICTARGKRQPEISGIRERKTEIASDNLEIYKKSGEKKNSSIAATLTGGAHSGGNHSDMDYISIPVLSPDRVEKRQNGRRFKEDGDLSFTLTAQDRHGVMLRKVRTEKGKELRKEYEAGNIKHGFNEHRTLEPKEENISGTISTFPDDNILLEDSIIRRLTPTECARLQDYPDDWARIGIDDTGKEVEISDTQQYKVYGNTITVKPFELIMREIYKVY